MIIRKIHVTGVVQGVGFRPFVYQLATRAQLRGWVANTSSGVDIEVEGDRDALDAFVRALENQKPPLARIDSIHAQDVASNGDARFEGFEIRASVAQPGAFQPISPDIATCPDCLRELFDPRDRRYLYPFINCTNCGPRFTIIRDIPYDRPLTTMRDFKMCDDCAREYHDPLNRRFHAQPVACTKCGPKVWLEDNSQFVIRNSKFDSPNYERSARIMNFEFISQAHRILAEGRIVAIKGLGGFHLACDATNDAAARTLRERKGRVDKPFALMARDVAAIENFCFVSDAERALLESRARPIVLLRRRPDSTISENVAPQNNFLGVMLPYTPLHYLLLESPLTNNQSPITLVMTSGNFSEEPIATDNADARARLTHLADYFLLHDRDIETRADDSVICVFENRELPMRRSRGYAPYPVKLPFETRPTLAVGAELKNTFCVTREQYAFLSQHIGDLENFPTLEAFQTQIEHFKKLFRIEPEIIAHDLHPEYLSTKYAKSKLPITNYQLLAVQHHHAHIAACMAENNLVRDERVIGIALDGTGYGTDNKIWGGELLITTYRDFERAAHLAYVALPGGDAGIKRVYRVALAHLAHAAIAWDDDLPCVTACNETERGVIRHQIETGLNAPLTSSMGRLFDAVAALIGVRATINYEAQAAIELEHLVVEDLETAYQFEIPIPNSQFPITISPAPVIRAIVADFRKRVPPWVIATKFHNAVAVMLREVAVMLREREGINRVALSGGVFQNVTLLGKTVALLRDAQFDVLTHRLVPPNDAGIALGQAAIANAISDFRFQIEDSKSEI
ncbi:MAG: carbamoyltransferase HypF [Chloroflexi bacterium]|nr:carbamoyltransferase HypF [Chloroflexota bacterium]